MSGQDQDWSHSNYFNYFTEVEEHFQRVRRTGLFLMSPLDWALVEGWKNSGIPLEAVLRGIDAAFEKWHARPKKGRLVNSVAYCTQAVVEQARILAGSVPQCAGGPVEAPFTLDELRSFLQRNAAAVRAAGYEDIGASLDSVLADLDSHYHQLEDLDQRLTVLEEKLAAAEQLRQPEECLVDDRMAIQRELAPYRGRMSAEQIAMIERQYLTRRMFERASLPRLSLFYLS